MDGSWSGPRRGEAFGAQATRRGPRGGDGGVARTPAGILRVFRAAHEARAASLAAQRRPGGRRARRRSLMPRTPLRQPREDARTLGIRNPRPSADLVERAEAAEAKPACRVERADLDARRFDAHATRRPAPFAQRATMAWIASRPSPSAAGPGCRMSDDFTSWTCASRTAGIAPQPGRAAPPSRRHLFPHPTPILMSRAR